MAGLAVLSEHKQLRRRVRALKESGAFEQGQVGDPGTRDDVLTQSLKVSAAVHRGRYHEGEGPLRGEQVQSCLEKQGECIGPSRNYLPEALLQIRRNRHLKVGRVANHEIELRVCTIAPGMGASGLGLAVDGEARDLIAFQIKS